VNLSCGLHANLHLLCCCPLSRYEGEEPIGADREEQDGEQGDEE